jgi:hypothetical protein
LIEADETAFGARHRGGGADAAPHRGQDQSNIEIVSR